MEDILEDIKDGKIDVQMEITDLLLYMLESVSGLIQDVSSGKAEQTDIEKAVSKRKDEVFAEMKPGNGHSQCPSEDSRNPSQQEVPVAPERRVSIGRRKDDGELFTGNFVKVDVRKIEEMLNLISEITIKKNYLLQRTKEAGNISNEILFAGKRLFGEVNDFADRHEYSTVTRTDRYVDPLFSEFGELEFDRYDEQNLFSRKLQEMTEDLSEAVKELSQLLESFQEDMKNMDGMIRLLRSDITDSRMMEIGRFFHRFVRPVRSMGKEYGKNVELRVSNGETKIDRVIFERIFDPFLHIIRNAICHGIETPAERILNGKKAEGQIVLSARREGSSIMIEIGDDGRGIDTDRLLQEGFKRGLFKHGANPSYEEILSLIFLPGVTTSESIDMNAGRGVGMNAVRRQLADLSGTIDVETQVNCGTTFRLRIPTTLAITNVLVFHCGPVEFVIPASLIEEVLLFDEVCDYDPADSTINYRGKTVSVKSFSELFNLPHYNERVRYVLICSISNRKSGLIVDDILGQEEAIIKPVNRFLDGLTLYSGVTISGDGKMRLVVNPIRVFEEDIDDMPLDPTGVHDFRGRRVLVVDDSLSVRKYVSSFLMERDCDVFNASNGIEALGLLEEKPVDLIITDLEMPLMHGYELIAKLKASESLRDIPVVVLTSRSTGKHREKALEIGASDYIMKPVDENSLFSTLIRYLLFPV
jgi:chemosensory pili system protein ChpA (sensor histidine kinase/response regulator)